MSFDNNWYHCSIRLDALLWNIIRISCKVLSSNCWKECNWNPRRTDVWDKFDDPDTDGALIVFDVDTVVPAIFSLIFNDQFQCVWIGEIA